MTDMKKNYPFKFSIVVAVYNVEKYLAEAIESILCQDIGFKESVQLILVDDGSPDNSGQICDEYQAKYPSNIKVIHKENGGVSSARNEGLKHVEGRYINFMDSDDKISPNTLSAVYDYFSTVDDQVDLVSIPLYFFEGKEGGHRLNYKFDDKKNQIIDLEDKYWYVQMSGASAFFKNEVLISRNFDTSLKYSEDAKLIMDILLDNPKYGIVPGAAYYYRVRSDLNSATNTCWQNKAWYINHIRSYSFWSIHEAKKRCGIIPAFVQFNLMYEMQGFFRMKKLPTDILSHDELTEFTELLSKFLEYIDASIIMEQKNMSMEQKDNAISMKSACGTGILTYSDQDEDAYIQYNGIATRPMSVYTARLNSLTADKKELTISGSVKINTHFPEPEKIFLRLTSGDSQSREIPCDFHRNPDETFVYAGKLLAQFWDFDAKIPFSELKKTILVDICLKYDSHTVRFKKIFKGNNFADDPSLDGNHISYLLDKHQLYLTRYFLVNTLKPDSEKLSFKIKKRIKSFHK